MIIYIFCIFILYVYTEVENPLTLQAVTVCKHNTELLRLIMLPKQIIRKDSGILFKLNINVSYFMNQTDWIAFILHLLSNFCSTDGSCYLSGKFWFITQIPSANYLLVFTWKPFTLTLPSAINHLLQYSSFIHMNQIIN